MNNYGAFSPAGVLSAVVTVVPGSTEEICFERVGERCARSNWTLK